MSYLLLVRPEAEVDVAEGFAWYEQRRSGLGYEFLAEVKLRLKIVEVSPLRCAVVYKNARQILIRRSPYKLVYLFELDKVEVLGVIHVRRRPESWQRRV